MRTDRLHGGRRIDEEGFGLSRLPCQEREKKECLVKALVLKCDKVGILNENGLSSYPNPRSSPLENQKLGEITRMKGEASGDCGRNASAVTWPVRRESENFLTLPGLA